METYDVFAPFYDAVQGDRAEHAAYVRALIDKHHPGAKTVLELACGTGSILKRLESRYAVTGVDLSEGMLEIAARKVPRATLIQGDMTRISLDETFDVVLCVYDSINHLLKFAEWEAVFERAREHLEDGGLFVFDINTERRLAFLAAQPALTEWFGDGQLMVMDVVDGGRGVVVWSIRVFEQLGGDTYRLHAEDIRETSFPADRVRRSLQKRFRRVWTYDARRKRPSALSERLHFVCRK
jgi:cyclopropane fatty-acyl-phospholipid synthase-like methyltransferase